MKVIKRDGRKVEFDENKIKDAIEKAYKEVYPDRDKSYIECSVEKSAQKVIENYKIKNNANITVE